MVFNILDYGAKPEVGFVNTKAIQEAIDACAANGGGQVIVPMGEFVTGGIRLRSHVHLFLEAGAILRASANADDYVAVKNLASEPRCDLGALVYANGEEDFSIDGYGTLLGNGQEDWGSWWGISTYLPFRVVTLLLEECKKIRLLNFNIFPRCGRFICTVARTFAYTALPSAIISVTSTLTELTPTAVKTLLFPTVTFRQVTTVSA